MEKLRIKIYAGLVCPRRSLDYRKLENYFMMNNCDIVKDPENATHIILITCGFIDRNTLESLNLITALKKYSAELIVGGCLHDIDRDILSGNFKGKIITTKDMDKIEELFPKFRHKLSEANDGNFLHDYEEINSIIGGRNNFKEKMFFDRAIFDFPNNSFIIRIGEGCGCKCTFCSHRNAIGTYKSKHTDKCIKEFMNGYANGYRIFKLTSMDTGSYGIDFGSDLPSLMNEFLNISGDIKFILDDINPVWLNKYRNEIAEFAYNKKIKIIQTPVQSGSNEILKKMKRWNNIEKLGRIISSFKECDNDILFATEVLLGFPGETDADFKATLNFLKKSGFILTYIYPYYENKNMESFKIFPKCSREIINKRIDDAVKFCEENEISYSVMLNINDDVLIQKNSEKTFL